VRLFAEANRRGQFTAV